eukprot:TRINITY_DN2052_c0_g1_i1.p1 TRINITY_DN2052_c0_g1~~TRINITY_DN2052_c0_g1_i1.p1  ORF type:complete len:190 (-),score=58.14 TRINITY_DN2052_c0_g1_i1:96-665(-)
MTDSRTAVPSCLGFLAVICLVVSLTGVGWWTVNGDIQIFGICDFNGSIDIGPVGYKLKGTGSCAALGFNTDGNSGLKSYSDGQCKDDANTALGLTAAAAALALIATVVHGMGKIDNPIVPGFFFVAFVLSVASVGFWVEKSSCIHVLKENKIGKVGVGSVLDSVGAALCFLAICASCFYNRGTSGYRRI